MSVRSLIFSATPTTWRLTSTRVLLRRRDEPDLVLGLAERDAERTTLFRALAVTFRSLVARTPSALEEAVLDAFAWTEFLPVKDRRAFLEEFSRTLVASADMDTYERLAQVVREWRATAEVPLSRLWRDASVGRSPLSMGGGSRPGKGLSDAEATRTCRAAARYGWVGLPVRDERGG